MILHGNTCMRRNNLPVDGEKYRKLRFAAPTMGDVITRTLLYDKGDVFCLPDVMHAHREGSANKTSFFSNQKTKAIEYSYMYCTIVDSLEEYFDGKYVLGKLKANRTGGVLMNAFVGNYKLDKSKFREYMRSLPLFIRILSYERFVQKSFRAVIHKIGRKLNLFYKT